MSVQQLTVFGARPRAGLLCSGRMLITEDVALNKALSVAALFIMLLSAPARGQASPAPSFDVSTVRLSKAPPGSVSGIRTGNGSLDGQNVTLKRCIIGAYGVGPQQVIAGPEWVDSIRFDIVAKSDQPGADEDVMLQGLLAERFELVLHRETKVMRAYVLEAAKNGPKLERADTGESNTNSTSSSSVITMELARTSMEMFAKQLSRRLDRPVVNNTGLEGLYNFKLQWTPDSARQSDGTAVDYGSIFDAIQQQLGLHIRPDSVPVETIVIDHAAMPTDN
jgi:uncharacterized protein (TIGR03435 family)